MREDGRFLKVALRTSQMWVLRWKLTTSNVEIDNYNSNSLNSIEDVLFVPVQEEHLNPFLSETMVDLVK